MKERSFEGIKSKKVRKFREGFDEAERIRKIEAGKPKSHKEAALQQELGRLVIQVVGRELEKAQADYETRIDSE